MRAPSRAAALAALALLLGGCAVGPPVTDGRAPRGSRAAAPPQVVVVPAQKPADLPEYVPGAAPLSEQDRPPPADEIPEGIDQLPDAVPQAEPRSRSGNSPVYEVFGKKYRTLGSAQGFRERGYASWYGKKFHGRKTASGELYNMFSMTAAHKRLPLPCYVRVTHLRNGKSTVVRVNDRGPFHQGRIIDLSYAAAAKIGLLDHGHAMVEIEALIPEEEVPGTVVAAAPPPVAPATPPPTTAELRPAPDSPPGYLQFASFVDPINAVAMREQLDQLGLARISVVATDLGGETLHRVVAGPFADEAGAAPLRERLRRAGHPADWVTP